VGLPSTEAPEPNLRAQSLTSLPPGTVSDSEQIAGPSTVASPTATPTGGHRGALVIIVALILGAGWSLSRIAEPLDRYAWDACFALLSRIRPAAPATNIAIIGLDEATMAALPEPLALLHEPLGTVLQAIADSGARAVALDLVLPDRSYDAIAPGHDLALMRGIASMRQAGGIVIARTVDDGGHERPIDPPLLASAGVDASGFALLPTDGDGRVRRVDARLGADGAEIPLLVGELARRSGAAVRGGLIDFSRPIGVEPVSMLSVLRWARAADNAALRRTFAGKVIFIGALLPFVDRHSVPVSISAGRFPNASTPGVYLQAQAYRTLMDGGGLPERPILAAAASALLCALGWSFATTLRSTLAVTSSGLIALALFAVTMLACGQAVAVGGPALALLAAAAFRFGLELRADAQVRQRMRRIFAGYVSPNVMSELEAGRLEGMTSQRWRVCVMFIDVRGFTSRAETEPPEKVTATLNLLFEVATKVIHGHEGTVKEFMGDGVMAIFGAPRQLPNAAQAAFESAREMLDALAQLNAELAARGEAPLAIGIGLAVGEAVVGHIGSAARHTYGAVGDCVNLASRLEGLTRTLGYPLLMSASVREAIGDTGSLVNLGLHAVKGHTPVMVWGWGAARDTSKTEPSNSPNREG
jgi:adenylate cyclase